MHVFIAFLLGVALAAGYYPLQEQPKEELELSVGAPGQAVVIRQDVRPLSEFRYDHVAKQKYDYSCGSAALSTILNYSLGEKFSEKQVIEGMLEYGDKEMIQKRRAFSLLDMKRFVNVLGYEGVGYRAEIDDLRTLDMPCIVSLEIFGYHHFVVFRGMYKDHIFLADPSQGNISFTLSEFKDMWREKVAFVVSPKGRKETSALKLTEDDLRFMDSDTTAGILFEYHPPFTTVAEQELNEVAGTYKYYKLK
jgi:predicted double-glycine peptidase